MKKKITVNPLELDKKTIAKLDEKQLQEVVGGKKKALDGGTSGCQGGGTNCS